MSIASCRARSASAGSLRDGFADLLRRLLKGRLLLLRRRVLRLRLGLAAWASPASAPAARLQILSWLRRCLVHRAARMLGLLPAGQRVGFAIVMICQDPGRHVAVIFLHIQNGRSLDVGDLHRPAIEAKAPLS